MLFAFCVLHLHSVIAIIFDNCMICASYCYYCTFIYIRLHRHTAEELSSVLSRWLLPVALCIITPTHTLAQAHSHTNAHSLQAHETCGIIIENTSNNSSPSLSTLLLFGQCCHTENSCIWISNAFAANLLNCLAKPKFAIGFDTFKNVFCIFGALLLVL